MPELETVPPIDFTTFVLSLSASVLMHMGVDPETGVTKPASRTELAMAKQTIDLLALLETKTHGNLTGEEERLLHQLVADLRLRFVDVVRTAK